jgi:hypothetical protein
MSFKKEWERKNQKKKPFSKFCELLNNIKTLVQQRKVLKIRHHSFI